MNDELRDSGLFSKVLQSKTWELENFRINFRQTDPFSGLFQLEYRSTCRIFMGNYMVMGGRYGFPAEIILISLKSKFRTCKGDGIRASHFMVSPADSFLQNLNSIIDIY